MRIKHVALSSLLLLFTLASVTLMAQIRPVTNHNALYVKDLKKSVEFYKTVMNFEEIPEPFHDGKHVWFRTGPHTQLHIVQGPLDATSHNLIFHFAYSVPDLDKFKEHLDKMHIKYGDINLSNLPPAKRPDGIQQIYFADPDNYLIEINDDKF